jgi:hypothetical protein
MPLPKTFWNWVLFILLFVVALHVVSFVFRILWGLFYWVAMGLAAAALAGYVLVKLKR